MLMFLSNNVVIDSMTPSERTLIIPLKIPIQFDNICSRSDTILSVLHLPTLQQTKTTSLLVKITCIAHVISDLLHDKLDFNKTETERQCQKG